MVSSGRLAGALMRQGVVDEYRFAVYPIRSGKGRRLFADGIQADLSLVEVVGFDRGIVLATYLSQSPPRSGDPQTAGSAIG